MYSGKDHGRPRGGPPRRPLGPHRERRPGSQRRLGEVRGRHDPGQRPAQVRPDPGRRPRSGGRALVEPHTRAPRAPRTPTRGTGNMGPAFQQPARCGWFTHRHGKNILSYESGTCIAPPSPATQRPPASSRSFSHLVRRRERPTPGMSVDPGHAAGQVRSGVDTTPVMRSRV